jgi:Outer membrane lipoprotein-sorting protein
MSKFLTLIILFMASTAFGMDARDIMVHNFNSGTVLEWETTSRMELIDNRGKERIRTGKSSNKLQKNGIYYHRLYRYFSPQDIQGTAVLVQEHPSEDDMWIYLPAMKKTRRITAGNKRDSFVGSDFSYGDVVSPKVDDYTHSIQGKENLEGVDCYKIESIPKNERIKRDTGYNKKVSWIRSDNYFEKKIDYYDEAGDLLKTQQISKLFQADQGNRKWIAMKREMMNHQTHHKTVITFDKIDLAKGLRDDVFSVHSLERAQ